MIPSQAKPSQKFTLFELLIVVAIIGILVSILLPSLTKTREMSKRAVCLSNQKQIYTPSIIYCKDNNYKYPQRMPAKHWPFGHYNSRSDGLGYTWDGDEGSTILSLKTAGLNALVESELITAYEVFYCPSSKWITTSKFLSRIRPGSTENWFVNYSYWPGYKRALAVDDDVATSRPANSDSDAMFMSDIIDSVGGKNSCHTAGGNITLNDGSAKWRNYSSMKYRYTHGFDLWW